MANPSPPTSLLGLPREIRNSIYEYCSPPQTASEVQNLWWGSRVDMGVVALLRVCSQIHDEAAPIFYGNKTHVLCLGLQRRCFAGRGIEAWSNKAMQMGPSYLKKVKSFILFVDTYHPISSERTIFLKYKAKLQELATNLAGSHSLRDVRITFNRYNSADHYNWVHSPSSSQPLPLTPRLPSYYTTELKPHLQHMLEPLAEIYGVPRVRVDDVDLDFAYKLERAMECPKKAVSPRMETYRTIMVKRRGRQRTKHPRRIYDLKYHESKLIWNEELLGPMPPAKENEGET